MSDAATVVLPPPEHRPDEPAVWDIVLRRMAAVPAPIDERLRQDIAERNAMGIEKYGQPLKANDGRDPLVDGFQEALDLVVYLAKDDVETEQEHGRWSSEHIESDATFWMALALARRLARQLERRGVR